MKSRVVPVTVVKKSAIDIQVIAERALNLIEEDIYKELGIDELDIADHSTVIENHNNLIIDVADYILTLAEEGERKNV